MRRAAFHAGRLSVGLVLLAALLVCVLGSPFQALLAGALVLAVLLWAVASR